MRPAPPATPGPSTSSIVQCRPSPLDPGVAQTVVGRVLVRDVDHGSGGVDANGATKCVAIELCWPTSAPLRPVWVAVVGEAGAVDVDEAPPGHDRVDAEAETVRGLVVVRDHRFRSTARSPGITTTELADLSPWTWSVVRPAPGTAPGPSSGPTRQLHALAARATTATAPSSALRRVTLRARRMSPPRGDGRIGATLRRMRAVVTPSLTFDRARRAQTGQAGRPAAARSSVTSSITWASLASPSAGLR